MHYRYMYTNYFFIRIALLSTVDDMKYVASRLSPEDGLGRG